MLCLAFKCHLKLNCYTAGLCAEYISLPAINLESGPQQLGECEKYTVLHSPLALRPNVHLVKQMTPAPVLQDRCSLCVKMHEFS